MQKASIRDIINKHTSQSERFLNKEGIFYSVDGKGSGYWGIRNYDKKTLSALSEDTNKLEEGSEILKQHIFYERNATVVKLAKINFKQKNDGKLYSEVCGFDFNNVYGDRGHDFIEAHHKKPVSQMSKNETTSVKDLCMVCSNCHKMLHRQNQLISVDELKEIINANRK